MAASSSAKFLVHKNQNKANSSSASPVFAADSDVVEFNEFRATENEAANLEKTNTFNEKSNNNDSDNNCRSRRPSNHNLEQFNWQQQPQHKHNNTQESLQQRRQVDTEAAAVKTISIREGITDIGQLEESVIDIEEVISTKTDLSFCNKSDKVKIWTDNNKPGVATSISGSISLQHSQDLSADAQRFPQEQPKHPFSGINSTKDPKTQQQESEEYSNKSSFYPKPKSNNNAPIKNNNLIQKQQEVDKQEKQIQEQLLKNKQNQEQSFQKTNTTIYNSVPLLNAMNSSQQTQAAPGNRITFTSQSLPNGTINIGGGHPPGSTIISTSQLPNTTTIKTITSSAAGGQHHGLPQQVQVQHHQVLQSAQQQQQQQHNAQSVGATQTQTLVIKSNHAVSLPAGLVSSAPGIVTMTKTINQGNQPLLNSMIPASVVVGMRPQGGQNQQKNMQSNTLGRVMIAPHVVGTRPQSPAITLSTLTPGQTPALILKTENGFQLLRVGTATSGPVTQTIGTNSTNPTQIRLQTVPAAVSRFTGPPIALRKTIVRSSTSTTSTTTTQQHQQQATMKQTKQNSMATTSTPSNIVVNSVSSTNSAPHVFTSQANISLQQQPTQTTSVATISGIQHQQQQQQQLHHQQQLHQQTQHLHTQPQITQIQTIPPQQSQQSLQQQQQAQQNSHNMSNSSNTNVQTTSTVTTTQSTAAQGNTKEKCRKFLANLIDLSTREPKPVEKNVRNLIQELVNANVEPEEFCDRLERLLNASPQPCLIGFLKKSLPLLRQALFTKELVIKGIKPPPQHVVGMTTLTQQLPKIQAQIRPISQNQTTTIGQTQVRMISPSTAPRPFGHTTITKQQGSIRIQGPTNAPRLVNAQIRGPIPATIQQHQPQLQTNPPHLQTVPTQANIVQIRTPTSATQINRPATVQIRTTKGKANTTATGITHVKVGQTQIKAIPSPQTLSTQPPMLASISNNAPPSLTGPSSFSSSSSILSTINSVASNSLHSSNLHTISGNNGIPSLPTPSLPTVHLPPHLTAASNSIAASIDIKPADIKMEPSVKSSTMPTTPATHQTLSSSSLTPTSNKTATKTASNSTSKASSKKKKEQDKEKDEKTIVSSAAAAATSFFQQPSISMSSSMYGDDDINDVAAMGGVNLAEESQRILGCTENIGTQIRSCKDEVFLHMPALQARIRAMVLERGLEEPSQDVAVLISHACQERLKNIVEKLAVIAEHRIDVIKLDPRYEVTKDVRGQIKFLEELDKAEQKRHEELEREMLLRAAKSRSKIEDPEQAKMKARAKEMQRAEMEELRQRDANMTALQAIGPRKKLKLDGDVASSGFVTSGSTGALGTTGTTNAPLRPRIKRVNLRDMLFFMEQERETCRSQMLYKAYLK